MPDRPSGTDTDTIDHTDRYAATPRWVWVLGIIIVVMVLAFFITLVTRGPHRPGMPGMQHGGAAPASSVVAPGVGGGHDPLPRSNS